MANNGEIFSIIQGYQHIHYQTKLDDDFKAQGFVSFHAVVGLGEAFVRDYLCYVCFRHLSQALGQLEFDF
jgi:hypothetical protein